MPDHLTTRAARGTVPITPLAKDTLEDWLAGQPDPVRTWVADTGFEAEPNTICLIPGDAGALDRALAGIDPRDDLWSYAALASLLPARGSAGCYALAAEFGAAEATRAALGWALGAYAFTRYRKTTRAFATLVWPKGADRRGIERTVEAVFLVRDLINTPAEHMGPEELAAAARRLARAHKAKLSVTIGADLLKANYPAVHAVGRASARAPRLIDLRWGTAGPRVSLVGKGVCFDTGGLDLKTGAGMKLMKKDMGGAAHALGLAAMVMAARLPVRLRVLVPAVENSVAGNALRPLDVIATRKGLTVEVGNTDAEGRLILCDALAEADRERPDLLIDFATLTGAARAALGTELPAMFCNDDGLADALLRHGAGVRDPVWRLPLYRPYRPLLDSKVADLNNISSDSYGGAIIAALFLAEFVDPETPWIHFDIMGWNVRAKPGRPEGGEAMGLRAAYALIDAVARKKRGPGRGSGGKRRIA